MIGGSPQSAKISTPFANALQVQVLDAGSNPVPGATVTFAAPGSGASTTLSSTTATTDVNGKASVTATANGTAGGPYTVTATVAGVAGAANFALTNTPGAPAKITVIGGSPQSAKISTPFANALQVQVLDAGNNPVPGATVTFAAPGSGASTTLSSTTATTDANGKASVTATANATTGGPYTVTATVAGVSGAANFALTNTPGAPAKIPVIGGSPQSAKVSTPFANALQVQVLDAGSNPVPGATVTFAAPGSGASTTLSSTTATTDVNGKASVTATANGTAGGPYTVTATVAGVAGAANFALTNTPGAPAKITVIGGSPQSAKVSTPFANALQVQVLDAGSNPVPGATVTFAAPGSGASTTLSSTTATTDVNGKASVTATANGTAGGPYTVTATVAGVAGAANFALTNTPGAPAKITVIGGSPQSAKISTPFANALQVQVLDAGNNPVPGATVTFAAPGSGASTTLSSTTATTDANGKASVTATANATAGGPYTVTATVAGVSGAANFALTNTSGIAAAITVIGGSPQSAKISTPFANALQVQVLDAGSNPVPGATVTFAAPGSGASTTLSSTTATTDANGKASVTATANGTTGGPYTVTATVAGVSGAANFALTNTPGDPTALTLAGGSGQSAKINTAFTGLLQVLVQDASNNPVSGVTVTFTPPASGPGGSFVGRTAVTDATGVATSTVFTANSLAGAYKVTATVGGLSIQFSLTNLAGPPTNIAIAAGTPQGTTILSPFSSPLKVLLTDASNNPVSGITVTFTAPGAGSGPTATFAGGVNTAVTDASGVATSAVLTASGTEGSYTIAGSAGPGLSVNFSLTNRPGPAALMTIAGGNSQSTLINTPFANALQVQVTDVGGNPIRGITVTFSAPVFTQPANGATGTFGSASSATAISDTLGMVFAPVFTANGSLGTYTVSATSPGLPTLNFTLTNSPFSTGNGTFTLTNLTIGKNLQTLMTITLNPPAPAGGVFLTIQSSDPSKALLGTNTGGQQTLSVPISQGVSIVSTEVQALASSGTPTITVSAPGYNTSTATVTLVPSGFFLAGPNGNGAPFTAFQGTSTPLTVIAGSMDSIGQSVRNPTDPRRLSGHCSYRRR